MANRLRFLTVCLASTTFFMRGGLAQAPEPGPLLTNPARGELRMLLDKERLGSSDVSMAERNFPANYQSAEHSHEGIEVIYIVSGEFQHVVNGTTHLLKPGMVGFVKPGDKVLHKVGPNPVKALLIWTPGEEGARVAAGWQEASTPVRPVQLAAQAAATATSEIEKDRTDTENWLKGDGTSYLATIGRTDFGDRKTLTVGRDPENDVRIDDETISPRHLRVSVAGDRFQVAAIDTKASFKVKDEEMRETVLDPSYVQVGRFTLRLSHQGFPAIIVFDPKSPHFKEYKGLKYFPVDFKYRYEVPLTPNPKRETMVIMSTLGNARRAERVGWFEFMVGDTPCRLEVTRLLEPGVGENDYSVFFRDGTSGADTYPLGRYVDPKKLPNGNYLLDFNAAYNPACAFSDHYNCPIPPRDNTLSVAIRAGEMDSHYH